jgi:hypothetical protein
LWIGGAKFCAFGKNLSGKLDHVNPISHL